MRHALLIALNAARASIVAATLAAFSAALLAAVPAPAQERPPLRAVLESCETGATADQRIATFTGSMPAVDRAERMWMRFDLVRRRPGGRAWRRVKGAPGFGSWERSLPRRAGFVFHKRVAGLRPGMVYRSVVRFRWYAADGALVQRARRRTRACRQPDLRPDLEPGALTAAPGPLPGTARYTLVVTNDGRSEAAGFAVRVGSGGSEVARMGPGERRTVDVVAPVCAPGEQITVAVDPDRRVEETRERGNTVTRECPLAAA